MPLTIGVYPGYQEIDLEPGGTYTGSFFVVNVGEEDEPSVDYRIISTPFSVSDDGETADYSTVTDRTRLSEWITFDVKEGVIEPNTKQEIKYTIHVPADAPVGGQYCTAAVRIGQDMEDADGVCDKLNTAYNAVKKNDKFVNFKSEEDKAEFTAASPITQTKRLISVFDAWEGFLKGEFEGHGFTFWIVMSVLVDIAAFIFFDLAFKKTDD